MRSILIPGAAAAILLAGTLAAQAAVEIDVNKDLQQMTVSVDGVPRYTWPVSSGNPSHETPSGSFRTFRMEEDHYSKEFDDAPMPHAIFFTKKGHAIHGTDSVRHLGSPVSHGCVRLSRAHATTLWNLVKREGLLNTTVTLTGSSRVALARNSKSTRVATREGDAGQPLALTPQRVAPGAIYDSPDDEDDYRNGADQDPRYQRREPRSYYGYAAGLGDPRWSTPGRRRLYPDPRSGHGYIEDDGGPAPAYRPQGGYPLFD